MKALQVKEQSLSNEIVSWITPVKPNSNFPSLGQGGLPQSKPTKEIHFGIMAIAPSLTRPDPLLGEYKAGLSSIP